MFLFEPKQKQNQSHWKKKSITLEKEFKQETKNEMLETSCDECLGMKESLC